MTIEIGAIILAGISIAGTALMSTLTWLYRARESEIQRGHRDTNERQQKQIDDLEERVRSLQKDETTKALEVRVRGIEQTGGEPVRSMKDEMEKIEKKIDNLSDRISKLTDLLIQERANHQHSFGTPRTGPGDR